MEHPEALPFPSELMQRYNLATGKLTKFQRALSRRFAPNVADVADEFNQLAASFDEAFLPQYAALSWLGAAQCHKALGNTSAEVDRLLRSADASIAADRRQRRQHQLCADRAHLENALRCYNQALEAYADDSPFRAAIIRKIKAVQAPGANNQLTSSFASPSHRADDLDRAADECVRTGDYAGALELRTELYDNIAERRMQSLYGDLLCKNELARVLLLLWLELPPSRQSPSQVKLLAECAACRDNLELGLPLWPAETRWAVGELVRATMGAGGGNDAKAEMERAVDRMLRLDSLRPEHRLVLHMLLAAS